MCCQLCLMVPCMHAVVRLLFWVRCPVGRWGGAVSMCQLGLDQWSKLNRSVQDMRA